MSKPKPKVQQTFVLDCDLLCEIMFGLSWQVAQAIPEGGSERDVTTIISRMYWNAFLIGVGMEQGLDPTDWLDDSPGRTVRVFGSKTIVVDREDLMSVSFATRE